jgi:hypothetical protein
MQALRDMMIAPVRLSLMRLRACCQTRYALPCGLPPKARHLPFADRRTMIKSAPRPVNAPPTEVAMRRPPARVSKSSNACRCPRTLPKRPR